MKLHLLPLHTPFKHNFLISLIIDLVHVSGIMDSSSMLCTLGFIYHSVQLGTLAWGVMVLWWVQFEPSTWFFFDWSSQKWDQNGHPLLHKGVQGRKCDRVVHKQLGKKDGKGARKLENEHSMTMLHELTEIIVSQFFKYLNIRLITVQSSSANS